MAANAESFLQTSTLRGRRDDSAERVRENFFWKGRKHGSIQGIKERLYADRITLLGWFFGGIERGENWASPCRFKARLRR